MNKNKIIEYYSEKVKEHGANSRGVDWNGTNSQYLRFNILSNIFEKNHNFSILDYGCGYGEFVNYLNKEEYNDVDYLGFDISNEMLSQAKIKHPNENFTQTIPKNFKTDDTILSGTLHIKLSTPPDEWKAHIIKTLNHLNDISRKGFSFNLLTSYSDEEYKKDRLYYASPEEIFKYCKLNFSRNVLLDHSYDLYEFTIFVKK